MTDLSPISFKRRYRLRDGRPVICLEATAPRGNDGFNWRAWFIDHKGRRSFHWYNAYGQWANMATTSIDLVEVK